MELKELTFEDLVNEGMTAVSLVENPAIQVNWIAFSKDSKDSLKFATVDEEKRILLGPVMIPDLKIKRIDQDGEPYEVFFTKETIERMREGFLKSGKQTAFTFEHQITVNGLTVIELWTSQDSEKDKSANYGFNLPAGTLYFMVKVDSDDIWKEVKAGNVKGFSLEGLFNDVEVKSSLFKKIDQKLDMLVTNIADLVNKVFTGQQEETNPEQFGSITVTAEDGATIEATFEGEVLEVGTELKITNEAGETVGLPDGVYSTESESYVVTDGKVAEISPIVAEQMTENTEIKDAIIATLEKFTKELSDNLDKKLESTIDQKISVFKSEIENVSAADPIVNAGGEPKVRESWADYLKRTKKH